MTNRIQINNERLVLEENKPFRLIVHIGAGKTGTTSIQNTLLRQREKLKNKGYCYLGLMLEHAPDKHHSWQMDTGTDEFYRLQPNIAQNQLSSVLMTTIAAIRKSGCHTAIWVNESFLRRGSAKVIRDVLAEQKKLGIEVMIVAYVRRHDAWARSAYVQWGIKHKTYRGPLQSFKKWKNKSRIEFSQRLEDWLREFPGQLMVRNLDAVGDVVEDFLQIAGVDTEGLEYMRTNETPSPEELVLRTLFNEQYDDKVLGNVFKRELTGRNIRFDRSLNQILEEFLPTKEELDEVQTNCETDRRKTNAILAKCGQPPIDETPLVAKSYLIDESKMMSVALQVMVHQSRKIQQIEAGLEKLMSLNTNAAANPGYSPKAVRNERQEEAEAPVFAISTGRSGSTLVQRILNCHPDLVMWGEHHGFINGLATAYRLMRSPTGVKFPKTAQDNDGPGMLLPTLRSPDARLEWVNPWSVNEFEGILRAFIRDYFASRLADGQRWGFKEIRYNKLPTLNMLRKLYPQGKFVFIQRDPVEVTRSKVFAFIKENNWDEFDDKQRIERIKDILKKVNKDYHIYQKFMENNPGIGMIVQYEDLVKDSKAVIEGMLDHLELDEGRYDWVLSGQVMGNVITTTKRDEGLINLIKKVNTDIGHDD